MKTNYDLRQKLILMVIALTTSMMVLGLNACQKTETEAEKTAPVVSMTVDKTEEVSRDAAEENMQDTRMGVKAAGEMVTAAGETSAAAYQEVGDRLDRSVDKGIDTYGETAHVAQKALNIVGDETTSTEATGKSVLNRTITTKIE